VFGYAFDITTNDIRNYSSGTHEIYLAYRLGDDFKISNSRY